MRGQVAALGERPAALVARVPPPTGLTRAGRGLERLGTAGNVEHRLETTGVRWTDHLAKW